MTSVKIIFEFDENGLNSYIDSEVFKVLDERTYITVVSGEPMLLTLYYSENQEVYTHDVFFY